MKSTQVEPWRVLLVDDDEDDYLLTKSMLKEAQYRKIELEWASSYEAGYRLLQQKPYHAVLVDYDLGPNTGIQLIREANAQAYAAPLILFTGRGSYDVDVEAMEAGATLYLTKSEVNTFLLERAIRYAIERKEVEQALRQRSDELEAARNVAENEKRRLQAVMEALPVGVAITDEKGGSIQANHAFDEVWGGTHFPAETVADYRAYQAWWPDTGRIVAPEEWASAQAVQHEKTVVGQFLQIQRFDGTRAYVLNSASPVRDFNDQVIGSAVVIQDISQLMETEQHLATSEQRYHMLFTSLLDGFALHEIICDPDGVPVDYRFLEINPAFEKLTGLRGEDIIGKTVLQVMPQIEAYWIEIYGKVALTGETVRFENYSAALAKDYEVVAFSPGRGQFATIFTDITERKQMERALRVSEQRYRSLFHNHHTVMLLIDPETGEIVDANPAACDFYGYSVDELTRKNITDINTLTPEQVHEEMQRAAAEQRSHFQFFHRLASGEERNVEVYSNPFQLDGRKLLYSMIYDVTDRRHKEQEIKRLALFPGENPNPVMRISLDGTLMYANRASSLLLQDWGCEVGQEAPEKWKEHIWEAAEAGSPYEVETESWGRIYSFILHAIYEEGYVNLYGRDITRQRSAEKELASHLANMQKLIEISIQIISEKSLDGLFQRIVDGARELTGAQIGVLGHHYLQGNKFHIGYAAHSAEIPDCPPVEDFNQPVGGVYEEILTRTSLRFGDEELQEHPRWRGLPQGHIPLSGLLGTRLVNQEGEGIHSIMLSHKREREFTAEDEALLIQLSTLGSLSLQHIQAREDAERQADELDAVINSMADAVLIYDAQGTMIRVNPAAVAAFGYNPVGEKQIDVVEKLSILHSDGRPVEPGELPSTQALHGQIVTNERFTFKSVGGRETAILASSAPVWVNDRLTGAAVVFRDVTEWEKTQVSLQEYAQRLEGANRELRDFAFIASHDLQEPVRKIRTFSERLQTRYTSSFDQEGLDLLMRMNLAAERMQRMISDLLELSRITTQGQPFTPVDLNQVIKEVISDLEVRLEQTGGQVVSNELPAIQADAQQMTQLFLNLIGNALKFHRPGLPPRVEISSRLLPNVGKTGQRKVEFRIEDNGIGFNPQYMERIFQPFQRLHSQSEYEGTGIGLSICQKIVERHGGSIRAESKPGEGSTFIVTLPV